ncbi:UNVERIFIED_CONTAM: Mitogen-activated protein kinase kinase kinase-A [Sesamum latifolium]|uniref:Mitogen-activated protein kinase kinase kinase-A n=1 Tax=Sesamum latifolium TaxID=2727402 RepID=A0AAW2VDD2_9LAMI
MAFDQNSIPKDLRPLNTARNVSEDLRISPVTSSGKPMEGFYVSPAPDVGGSPGSMPAVYYPSTVADARFIPLAFNNAVPGATSWAQHVAPPQTQPGIVGVTVINPGSGYSNSPSIGTRVGGSASDQASDEGGDDSVSGRKVKFLCSFGGKILPRLSDGALRYVSGQTRIISVRRDVTFSEFVQKMRDTYVQNVVIKYQLPDEDLDALVSVSCPDDLENMMDEYERLTGRSSDGSAKLRIFLFSPSELETAGLTHIGDMHDSGQKYVEAVNGIMDSGPIARKESIESASSAQISDISGTEGADSLGHGLGEVTGLPSTGGLSPKGNSGIPLDTAPRMVCVDPNPVPYSDPSVAPMGIAMVKSGATTALGAVPEQEVTRPVPLAVPQALPGVTLPASSPYMQAYVDPRQETLGHANYAQFPSQMGFATQILGPVRPVFTQQPITAGASPRQYPPSIHMTMNPSYMSMSPNAMPAVVQPQHVRVEQYPAESMVAQRVVQLPAEQGYNAHPAPFQATAPGGVYNWHQVPHSEQMAFSDGALSPQQVMLPEKTPILEDCHMCQKALPHAHSDTAAQEQMASPAGMSDLRSMYNSLHLDERGRPMIRHVVTGTTAEGNSQQLAGGAGPRVVGSEDHEPGKSHTEAIGVSQNVEGQYVTDKVIAQKAGNAEHSKVTISQGVMMTSGHQFPYGVYGANSPQSCQTNAVQNVALQPQLQVTQDTMVNRPSNKDFSPVGMTKDYVVREFPKEYSVKVAGGILVDDSTSVAFDNLRQIDGRFENMRIRPSEVLPNNEHIKFVSDPRKEDTLEHIQHQIARGEAPKTHNFPSAELYEVAEPPPPVGNPNLYHYSPLGINHLSPDDTAGNSVYSGVESGHGVERIPPVTECKEDVGWSQSKITCGMEAVTNDGLSISPSYTVGNIPDHSASLFIDQDPWNMRPDTHFPPPRPSKIQIRRENAGLRDPPVDNRPLTSGEALAGNSLLETPLEDGAYQPSGNLNLDFSLHRSLSNKGSAEEQIKQELQAVAEGVAASVLHSSVPSNPDLSPYATSASSPTTQHNGDVQPANVEIHNRDKFEIIKNGDLEELRELGSGTFGTVYHGKWRGTDVAIKRINDRCFAGKPSEQERMRDDFWNEAIKLADLHHPNVVAFYGVVLDGPDGSVATVTEYMVNGSLRNALQKSERNLDKRKRLVIGMDVAFGMEYLHGKNIVHFDLKSDNLLVNLRDPHRPICKVDVFSFGIVMWELLTGEEPYADLHYGAIIGGIVSNTLRPPVPETCDPDWRILMERCWSAEPSERPNFTEIANELRAMAAKLPPKGQGQQQSPSTSPQLKS